MFSVCLSMLSYLVLNVTYLFTNHLFAECVNYFKKIDLPCFHSVLHMDHIHFWSINFFFHKQQIVKHLVYVILKTNIICCLILTQFVVNHDYYLVINCHTLSSFYMANCKQNALCKVLYLASARKKNVYTSWDFSLHQNDIDFFFKTFSFTGFYIFVASHPDIVISSTDNGFTPRYSRFFYWQWLYSQI